MAVEDGHRRDGGGGSSRRGGWPCPLWWLTTTIRRREAGGAREGGVRRGRAAPLLPPRWTLEEGHEGSDACVNVLEGSAAFRSAASGKKRGSCCEDHAMDERPESVEKSRRTAGYSSRPDCRRCRRLPRGPDGGGGCSCCVDGGGGGGGREWERGRGAAKGIGRLDRD